ncbi:MAG: prephenate dehydrogenase/arogenate dehydrogenase family protein [Vicinamibacterales bacterium]
MPAPAPLAHVGVVGLGLVGGSVARAVRRVWPAATVTGLDQPDVIETARRADAITRGVADLADLDGADLVVLATPVPGILAHLEAAARAGFSSLLTDVGSVKRTVVETAAARGVRRFVGGHPMAGDTRTGFAASRADLFAGRPWFVTAPPGAAGPAGEDDARAVDALARALGAEPVRMAADAHDRLVAYLSHLPQLVSVAVMTAATEACGVEALGLSGSGFADVTRLAASDGDLWSGILTANHDYVEEAARAVAAVLGRLGAARAQAPLVAAFLEANDARRRLDAATEARPDAARETTP